MELGFFFFWKVEYYNHPKKNETDGIITLKNPQNKIQKLKPAETMQETGKK